MHKIESIKAVSNYENYLERARWVSKGSLNPDLFAFHRLRKDIFRPVITNDMHFSEESKFFAMGSCFAREVEHALSGLGIDALSLVKPGDPINFRKGGYTNRYNTYSMLNEIKFAFGEMNFDHRSIVATDDSGTKFLDLHSHPAGGYVSFDEALARRKFLMEYFSRLSRIDVFVVTLGLVETWFDHETQQYINVSPASGNLFKRYKDRFEFRVLSHAENIANLEEIYSILKTKGSRDIKIIVTTSPVPLLATFSDRDVVIANTYSKSTLRSCAEHWCWSHPGEIEYFPSYEMAINSNPDLVWEADRIHVKPVFVRQIMKTFLSNYIQGWKLLLNNSPEETREITAAIAEGMVSRGAIRDAKNILEALLADDEGNITYLATTCRANFKLKDYEKCIEQAHRAFVIWQSAPKSKQNVMTKDVAACLRFGTLACFNLKEPERGLAMYEQALEIKTPFWDLGIRVASRLVRLKQRGTPLDQIFMQLENWSNDSPEHRAQLETLKRQHSA